MSIEYLEGRHVHRHRSTRQVLADLADAHRLAAGFLDPGDVAHTNAGVFGSVKDAQVASDR